MTALLRAEIRKFRWTRSLWALALVAYAISVGAGTVLIVAFRPADIADRLSHHGPLRFGLSNVGLIIALLGIRILGDEIQHHTLAATFLRAPNRARVITAKVVVAMALSLAITLTIYTIVVPTTLVILNARGIAMVVDGGATLALFARVAATMAIVAALGVGLAGVIRNRTVALIAFVLGITLGESIIGGLLRIPRYMPSELVNAVVSGGGGNAVAPGPAFALLAGLAITAVGLALGATRGDIS